MCNLLLSAVMVCKHKPLQKYYACYFMIGMNIVSCTIVKTGKNFSLKTDILLLNSFLMFKRQYKKIIDKIKKMQVYKPGSVAWFPKPLIIYLGLSLQKNSIDLPTN